MQNYLLFNYIKKNVYEYKWKNIKDVVLFTVLKWEEKFWLKYSVHWLLRGYFSQYNINRKKQG